MTLELFFQQLVTGISLGAIYALIAVGYNIIYGILGLINIAQGSVFMVGGFLAMWGVYRYSLPWPLSFALAMGITMMLGVAIEKVAYKPLRDFTISSFTAATGVSFLLQNIVIVFFTAIAKPFPRPKLLGQPIHLGPVVVPMLTFFTLAASSLSFLLLSYMINRTKTGMSIRALAKNLEATKLMGVDTDRVITLCFALSTAYAVLGAIMWGWAFLSVDAFSGVIPGMKGLIGAVIGGVGSIPGALLGGFILGLAEVMLISFLPNLSSYRDVFAYSLLILFLLVKPGGLFNVTVREEKV